MTLCDYAGLCAGCNQMQTSPQELSNSKINSMSRAMAEIFAGLELPIEWRSLGPIASRDRTDLTLQQNNLGQMELGFYSLSGSQLLDIQRCPQLSPDLSAWFNQFREDLPQLKKGSLRLRVAPDGRRGVWLDFANLDVKHLFDEGDWLRRLLAKAVVEIGQRRKRLTLIEGRLRLVEPELQAWFESYDFKGRAIPLYGLVGGFTQPGFKVNRLLVESVLKAVKNSGAEQITELYCGSGNFSLALAASGYSVVAVENDPHSIMGLKRELEEAGLELDLHRLDLQRKSLDDLGELLLVDPPRSGLGPWLELNQSQLLKGPEHLIYVSCFQDSLLKDAIRLSSYGFRPIAITGVDQFPMSTHSEWLVHFYRGSP